MEENKNYLVFSKMNYMLMIAGIVIIAIGLFIMTLDTEDYGYGFLGITLGPLVLMAGFVLEIFAIMWKDKKKV